MMSTGDPHLVFDNIRKAREAQGVYGFLPRNLSEAMPNTEFWFLDDRGQRRELSFGDAVVLGTVTKVAHGPAYRHDAEDVVTRVDFDDPAAVERTVDITVAVDEYFARDGAAPKTVREIVFRWGGLGSMDPSEREEYVASLQALGRIAVVLTTRADQDGQVFIPVLRGGLLGQITESGEVRFPGLGADEASFVRTIQTVADLRNLASSHHRLLAWGR